jgi:hypothetical protein
VSVTELLKEIIGVLPCETVQKDSTNDRTTADPEGVNSARPLKVSKVKRF